MIDQTDASLAEVQGQAWMTFLTPDSQLSVRAKTGILSIYTAQVRDIQYVPGVSSLEPNSLILDVQ